MKELNELSEKIYAELLFAKEICDIKDEKKIEIHQSIFMKENHKRTLNGYLIEVTKISKK